MKTRECLKQEPFEKGKLYSMLEKGKINSLLEQKADW